MDIKALNRAASLANLRQEAKRKRKECAPPGECFRNIVAAFPPLFPGHLGTPKTTPDTKAESRPTRERVFHELRKVFGKLTEDYESGGEKYAPDPVWKGFSTFNPLAVNMRQGGPSLSGPGFAPTVEPGAGGRYDFGKSPGLGFRTEAAWRVWQAALDILAREPTATPQAIFQAATARAGVRYGQLDPSEARLLEMGIEWYLSDPGALAAKRDGNAGPPDRIADNMAY